MFKRLKKTTNIAEDGSDKRLLSKTKRRIKKSAKKLKIGWLIAALFLCIGAVAGYFAHKFAFASDTYTMVVYANGKADVTIGADEEYKSYTELGVNCVAFGKDYSKDCSVKYFYRADLTTDEVEVEKVDENVAGIYYAVYSCPSIKYKTVTLIRNIIVIVGEDNG